jgi:hypothetical protein
MTIVAAAILGAGIWAIGGCYGFRFGAWVEPDWVLHIWEILDILNQRVITID